MPPEKVPPVFVDEAVSALYDVMRREEDHIRKEAAWGADLSAAKMKALKEKVRKVAGKVALESPKDPDSPELKAAREISEKIKTKLRGGDPADVKEIEVDEDGNPVLPWDPRTGEARPKIKSKVLDAAAAKKATETAANEQLGSLRDTIYHDRYLGTPADPPR